MSSRLRTDARTRSLLGDACRAATLYRLAIQENGRNPLFNARLQRAIGRLGCDRDKAK